MGKTASPILPAVVAASVVLGTLALTSPTRAAADPTRSPPTTISADGRSATDGARTLTVSQSTGLAPDGQSIRVTGSGYDPNKGVYVALCVIPPPNVLPTPCGGGVDVEGQAGASQWISSNPPSYGVGLARAYGPGGSFDTTFNVRAGINPTVDCRMVRCAILTRNDHTRSADRSQDILIPVTFQAPGQTTAPPGGPPAAPTPGPTPSPPAGAPTPAAPTPASPTPPARETTTTTTTPPAPDSTLAEDGRSVTDGTRTLRVDRSSGLDPQDVLTVTGDGFDVARGIYVALCRVDVDEPAGTDARPGSESDPLAEQLSGPGPCSTGDGRSAWISSNPPEWGADLAEPYDEGGGFEVELAVDATIDGDTDCTTTTCAVVVRADDTAPTDRSLDLVLPVEFSSPDDAGEDAADTTSDDADETGAEVAAATLSVDDESGTPLLLLGALALLLAAAATGATVLVRRRRAAR